jgi:hypothetical protein
MLKHLNVDIKGLIREILDRETEADRNALALGFFKQEVE